MRINRDEIRFDIMGWAGNQTTQRGKGLDTAYVAELVGKTNRTIMNIENKGQHPSFNLFFQTR